jgi:hypothetical protein
MSGSFGKSLFLKKEIYFNNRVLFSKLISKKFPSQEEIDDIISKLK